MYVEDLHAIAQIVELLISDGDDVRNCLVLPDYPHASIGKAMHSTVSLVLLAHHQSLIGLLQAHGPS